MSLFRVVKYSSILFFLGKYKVRLFRVVGVLLFALLTSLLYQDVAAYLELRHPGTVVYALTAKIIIVYGALGFVLWQFKPESGERPKSSLDTQADQGQSSGRPSPTPLAKTDRLSGLEDLDQADTLNSRYDRILKGNSEKR